MTEGAKVVTVAQPTGRLLVTADLHGNWDDFDRLRQLFLAAEARGERPIWVSVGDWFRSWPLCVRVPGCALVITHGAMSPGFATAGELEQIRYATPQGPLGDVLFSAMSWYGFSPGQDDDLLARLSDDTRYAIIVHGHDREESGHAPTAERALLLCTSFGAVRARKAYLWLDLARRYESLAELREGHEIRFLWPPGA